MVDKRKLVLNAKQLRKGSFDFLRYNSGQVAQDKRKIKRNNIYIVLDNVLDTYNIGSIFRLADAVAAKKIYLCGGTETPPNHRIKKASINTTEVVDWEYCETALEAIKKVKSFDSGSTSLTITQDDNSRGKSIRKLSNIQIVAVEQTANSIQYDKFEYKLPLALVVGHETSGVSPEVLKIVDGVVELPMFGVNKSLNVMVSLGVILYKVIEKTMLEET